MNQTWENGKKTIFGPDFCLFLPKFVPPNFFLGFSSTRCSTLLQAITVYNSRKTSEPNLRQWQFWPSFGPDFAFFGPDLHPKNFLCGFYLYWMLDFVASYHCTQFQAKLMNQTWGNGKKFVLIIFFFFFAKIWLSVTRYHGQLPSGTLSEKTNDPISRKLSDRWQMDKRMRVISEDAVQLMLSVQNYTQSIQAIQRITVLTLLEIITIRHHC